MALVILVLAAAIATLTWSALCVHRATRSLRDQQIPLRTRRQALDEPRTRR